MTSQLPEPSGDSSAPGENQPPEWFQNVQQDSSALFAGTPDQQQKARTLRAEDEIDKYGIHRTSKEIHIYYDQAKDWLGF